MRLSRRPERRWAPLPAHSPKKGSRNRPAPFRIHRSKQLLTSVKGLRPVTRDQLSGLLETFRTRRIAVLGDFLLDEYIIGDTSRVSREAPIVVVDYQDTVHHPGGASNAAQNVTAAGGAAIALGICGTDREGDTLTALLESKGVDSGGLLRDSGYATPLKLRILAGEMNAQKQQVARVDRSGRLEPSKERDERLRVAARAAIESSDAVLISDYGVGLVPGALSDEVIAWGRERGIPVVVDSRFRLTSYRGATVATPNEVEALEAIGVRDESTLDRGQLSRRLTEASGIEHFIVTRGSKGMRVCDAGGSETTIGIVGSNEATDVTGAGDTVSAYVSLSLASGASIVEAAQMATYAAAVVVMKRGTATATPDEVTALIESNPAI
jgi:rfaE bifunctional protein kinase chain/domain